MTLLIFIGAVGSPIQEYIRMLRLYGGVVNARQLVVDARGLIIARNR